MKVINFEKPVVGEKNYARYVGGTILVAGAAYLYYQGGQKIGKKNEQIGGNHTCTVTPQDCNGYTCYGC